MTPTDARYVLFACDLSGKEKYAWIRMPVRYKLLSWANRLNFEVNGVPPKRGSRIERFYKHVVQLAVKS